MLSSAGGDKTIVQIVQRVQIKCALAYITFIPRSCFRRVRLGSYQSIANLETIDIYAHSAPYTSKLSHIQLAFRGAARLPIEIDF